MDSKARRTSTGWAHTSGFLLGEKETTGWSFAFPSKGNIKIRAGARRETNYAIPVTLPPDPMGGLPNT
jgi:hypothetical protein